MNFRLLKKLYSIHSKSGQEGKMISFIYEWINTNVKNAFVDVDWNTGNMYITKGNAQTFPCIVAHLDQVQDKHPRDFVAVETRDIIFGYSPKTRKQCGLGADDKNGIWIALKCLQKYDNIKLAFFVSEEVGCIGSSQAKMDFFKDCRFVIEPDRRGNSDFITEISCLDLCSDEFITAVSPENYGYTPTNGMMTDVEELKEQGLEVSCCNMSCGYYDPHTDHEFTVKRDIIKCLRFVEHIIEDCTQVYPHTPQNVAFYQGYSFGWCDEYDELYDIIEHELQADPTKTPSDFYAMYHSAYPRLNRDDYAMIVDDATLQIKYNNEPEYDDLPFMEVVGSQNKKA